MLNISFPDRSHLPNEKLPEVHDVDPEETDEVATLGEHKLPDFSTEVSFNEINFDWFIYLQARSLLPHIRADE